MLSFKAMTAAKLLIHAGAARSIVGDGHGQGHVVAAAAAGAPVSVAPGVPGASDEVRGSAPADAGGGSAVVAEVTMRCPRCRGAGRLPVDEPECNGMATSAECERCGGSGVEKRTAADPELEAVLKSTSLDLLRSVGAARGITVQRTGDGSDGDVLALQWASEWTATIRHDDQATELQFGPYVSEDMAWRVALAHTNRLRQGLV
ncbi:MAG TPA: hypothetical protein VL614_15090 [Acetobacteraceae bacterium]|nr:hypothetical protein [Acetobacteraceae bacterium]